MFNRSDLTSLWSPPLRVLRVADPGQIPDTQEWHWTERHLQCLWCDEGLRPKNLRTTSGEIVRIIDPGKWNLEAGPDFLNAVLTLSDRTVKGDVEIHIRPADWESHHHNRDPRYANVVLHVTWFPAITPTAPAHIASLVLREGVMAMPRFSFDAIDLSAYPHAALPASPRPCGEQLADAPSAHVHALLEDAGMSRLRRKSMRMAMRLQVTGSRRQAFYEGFMTALGYKPNAQGMQAVAERLPVDQLAAHGDFVTRFAALLGTAGLLPPLPAHCGNPYATECRKLWDRAWKLGLADGVDRPAWQLAGTRPVNHPRQRLSLAAVLFSTPDALLKDVGSLPRTNGKDWARAAAACIQDRLDESRGTVPAPFQKTLRIGDARINTILINVVIPLLMAEDAVDDAFLKTLPGEALNEQIKEAAFRLLGRDHNPALYRTRAVRMQGLIEIWNGFCLSTKSECADCPLAEALRRARGKDLN